MHDKTNFSGTASFPIPQGWILLDGKLGDCDDQARCMKVAADILGLPKSHVRLVKASEDAGAGNCLDFDTRVINGKTQYLLLDCDTGDEYNWNLWQGCCETNNRYYSITPEIDATNDYEILKQLKCQQWWCLTTKPPSDPRCRVIKPVEEVPKP